MVDETVLVVVATQNRTNAGYIPLKYAVPFIGVVRCLGNVGLAVTSSEPPVRLNPSRAFTTGVHPDAANRRTCGNNSGDSKFASLRETHNPTPPSWKIGTDGALIPIF